MDGEGNSSRGPTAFETIIHPNQDTIEVSQVFATSWKDVIAVNKIGSIKDPADNFFQIDTSTILTEFTIHVGNVISYHYGFDQPQRVILDYQPHFNQFDMRIIDDEGRDIPYFGFHNPENDHAMKLADPTYEVKPHLISKVQEGGKMFFPIGFAMRWMGLAESVHEARNAENQQDDEEEEGTKTAEEEDTDEEDEEVEDDEHIGHPFEWFIDVSDAVAHGRSVLHFPKWVARAAHLSANLDITIINDATNEMVECKVKKSARSPPEYSIGRGWYHFVNNMNLNIGDQLIFGLEDPPTFLHVGVLRDVHPPQDD